MELRIATADGYSMPPGCFVGVKLGGVLKQGRYEPHRAYQFPAVEPRRNAKIDIYKHIGTCNLVVDPEVKNVYDVSVTDVEQGNSDLKLKVNVSATADLGKDRDVHSKEVRIQAKDYLSRFGIEEKLSEVLKVLLKEQPADPIEFICRHLRSESPPSREKPASQPVPQPQAQKEPEPAQPIKKVVEEATQPAVAAPAAKPAAPPPAAAAAAPGVEVLPFSKYYSKEVLPGTPSSFFSSLYSKFPAPRKEAAAPVAAPAAAPAAAAAAPAAPTVATSDGQAGDATSRLEALRTECCAMLLKACNDGMLKKALQSIGSPTATNVEKDAAPTSAPAVEPAPAAPVATEPLVEQKAKEEQQEVSNNSSTGAATGKFFHKPSVASWLALKPVASENTSVGQSSRVVIVPSMMQFGPGAISFGLRPGIKAL